MSAFSFCIFTVPTTCSRPSTKMSAFSFCIFTVPTTCSRPSTKMSAFMFFFFVFFCFFSFSVAGALARAFEIKDRNCAKKVLC